MQMIGITPFWSQGRGGLFRFLNAIEFFFGDIRRMRVWNQEVRALAKTCIGLIVEEGGIAVDAIEDVRRPMNLPIEMTFKFHLPRLTYTRFPLRIDFPLVRQTRFAVLLVSHFDRCRLAITTRWETTSCQY
jgi:hypothetical protein